MVTVERPNAQTCTVGLYLRTKLPRLWFIAQVEEEDQLGVATHVGRVEWIPLGRKRRFLSRVGAER